MTHVLLPGIGIFHFDGVQFAAHFLYQSMYSLTLTLLYGCFYYMPPTEGIAVSLCDPNTPPPSQQNEVWLNLE